ncbi:MAG: DNA repair protein RadA [Thermoleophilia bacterium]
MTARAQTAYVCRECGRREARWVGHCPACGSWDSFAEELVSEPGGRSGRSRFVQGERTGVSAAGPLALRLGDVASSSLERFTTGIDELDLVLGGGVVPGSLVLVGGEPGIGKSTLLLQALDRIAACGREVVLVCGEESAAQVKMRAERVCVAPDEISVLAATDLDEILPVLVARAPAAVVIDSIQTLSCDTSSALPGSVSQVREVADRFLRFAKETGTAVFLVGHVTKDGGIAGPRVLEHVVDAVLQFEGDAARFTRFLRASKNRFGSTDELGVFEMDASGLRGVDDPSRAFLGHGGAAGTAVHIAIEGSRCYLVEVEALVSRSELATPRRVAVGFDRNRLTTLVAVLERHAKLPLSTADVFVSIAGGIRVDEPAADLSVALAIASAERGVALPPRAAIFGEISLTGQLRSCSQSARRVTEAARAGFDIALVPAADARALSSGATGARSVREAITILLSTSTPRSTEATSDDGGV